MSLPARSHPHTATVHRMTPRHDFTALRRHVRCDSGLPAFARLFFEDVCELSEKKGHCWAEDEHFANKFGVTERAVRKWKTVLIDAGYLRRTTQAGRQVLKPVTNEEGKPESKNRNNGSERGTSVPSVEQRNSKNLGTTVPTLRVYIPLREEREARTHEGSGTDRDNQPSPPSRSAAVAAYREITGASIIADQFAAKILRAVGNDPADVELWEGIVRIWTESTWNERNVLDMIDAFVSRKAKRGSSAESSAVALDRWGKPIDLAAPFLRVNVPAVQAAHPGIPDGEFHPHGSTKDGALVRLSLDWRQKLGVSK